MDIPMDWSFMEELESTGYSTELPANPYNFSSSSNFGSNQIMNREEFSAAYGGQPTYLSNYSGGSVYQADMPLKQAAAGQVGGLKKGGSFLDLLKLLQQTNANAEEYKPNAALLSVSPAPFSVPSSSSSSSSMCTLPTPLFIPAATNIVAPTSTSSATAASPPLQVVTRTRSNTLPSRKFGFSYDEEEDGQEVFTPAKAKWAPPSSALSSSPSSTVKEGLRRKRKSPSQQVEEESGRPTRRRRAGAAQHDSDGEEEEEDGEAEEEEEEDEEGEERSRAFSSICLGDDDVSMLSFKRARNREHAKRSRMRKKVKLDGLEEQLLQLRSENLRLKSIVKRQLPDQEEELLSMCAELSWSNANRQSEETPKKRSRGRVSKRGSSCLATIEGKIGSTVPSALQLMEQDSHQMKVLTEYQHNIFLTCPQNDNDINNNNNNNNNPIVFASTGFLKLTGYTASDVIGRNIDFLHGPGTDETSIDILNNNRAAGRDSSVCFLCYRKDRTPFWMQLYLSPLRNVSGEVVNFVGVGCAVEEMSPMEFRRRLHRVPLPEDLLVDDDGSASAT